jgi:dTDP-4-dehydrorhamnose 3,5-epimerase-like enzyme
MTNDLGILTLSRDSLKACASARQDSVALPRVTDSRGILVVAQTGEQVPFEIRRMFFVSMVAPGSERGHHAHRTCHELLVVPCGAVTIDLEDSQGNWTHRLAEPDQAVHVPPMTWIVLREFEPDTICIVLASEHYDPADYIHEYHKFKAAAAVMRR